MIGKTQKSNLAAATFLLHILASTFLYYSHRVFYYVHDYYSDLLDYYSDLLVICLPREPSYRVVDQPLHHWAPQRLWRVPGREVDKSSLSYLQPPIVFPK